MLLQGVGDTSTSILGGYSKGAFDCISRSPAKERTDEVKIGWLCRDMDSVDVINHLNLTGIESIEKIVYTIIIAENFSDIKEFCLRFDDVVSDGAVPILPILVKWTVQNFIHCSVIERFHVINVLSQIH